MNKENNFRLESVIHVLALVYVFGSPLFLAQHGESIPWQKYVQFVVVPIALCITFYVNYLFLMPRLFMRHRYKAFYVANLLLLVCFSIGIDLFMNNVAPLLHQSMAHSGHFAHGPHHLEHPHHAMMDMKKSHLPEHFHSGAKRTHHHLPMMLRDVFSLIFAAAGAMALRLSIEWRHHELQYQQLKLQHTDAALQNLRSQTSPHFLLNTLNNIYALTSFDVTKAQHAILELSKMLRYQLYESDVERVSLRKEADFLRHYIALMRLRLDDRVSVTTKFDISMADEIAPHILIPLVENAFKHGVSADSPSSISVTFESDGHRIHFLCVNTNYPQDKKGDTTSGGIGLRQVKSRLQLLYPDNHTWTHGVSDDGKYYNSEIYIFNSVS